MCSQPRGDPMTLDVAAQEFFQRSRFAIGDAARNDQVKIPQIGRDVVCESMGANPAAEVYADGPEFFFGCVGRLHRDAGSAGDPARGDAVLERGANHDFLEHAHVPTYVAANGREIQDGIADDLAGTMVGDIATAAAVVKLDAFLPQYLLAHEQVFTLAIASLGDDVGMLAQEKNVFDGADFARCDSAFLQRAGVGVTDEAEIDDEAARH